MAMMNKKFIANVVESSENTYTSTFIYHCIQSRRHVQNKNTTKDMRKKSMDLLFLEKQVFMFCLLSVRDLLRLIL